MQTIMFQKPLQTFRVYLTLACLLLVVNLSLVFILKNNEQLRLIVSDILFPLITLLTTATLFFSAIQIAKTSRRLAIAWGILAIAQLFLALGDIAWAVIEVGYQAAPFPSIADGFYVSFYPIFLAGVLCLPGQRSGIYAWLKKVLDMGIVLTSAVMCFWNFLIGPVILAGGQEPVLNQFLTMAYPVGDLLLVFALVMLLYNYSNQSNFAPITLLTLSITVMVVTDSIFSYQSLLGTYVSGGLLDIGWILSYFLTGLAALWQALNPYVGKENRWMSIPEIVENEKSKILQTYLPYGWAIAAFILLLFAKDNQFVLQYSTIAAGVGVIISLIIIRQIIAFSENRQLIMQLNQALETVQQQSFELKKTNNQLEIEIYERKCAEEQLSFGALHDALTGLPNRALLLDRLGHAMEHLKRQNDLQFSVLFLDLDHFKVINDSLGHPAGDLLLISVAKRLITCLRSSDTVARMGGDEFVILLENTQEEAVLMTILNRIQEHLREPYHLDGHEVYISTSIGVVLHLSDYLQPDEVLRDADIALYRAKAEGKARFVIFDDVLRAQAITRLDLENDLRKALSNQELSLCYQPIYLVGNNNTQQLRGFEALLRWYHPVRGMLLPADFLHMAEETGLIIPMGQWVLQTACAQLKEWHDHFPLYRSLTMNVNISGIQFAHPEFVHQVTRVLQSTGLSANFLKLEITESALIENKQTANEIFQKLCKMGIQLQIDDFGTGYSSLSYLQRFPVHTIKIDKSFVQEIRKDGKGFELIRTIVQMATDLGMETIAEGVETEEQLNTLKNLRCNTMQGYKLSRPMDKTQVRTMLNQ